MATLIPSLGTCLSRITPGMAPTLADNLHAELRSVIATNLRRMVQFAQAFVQPEIVATLSRQLSWSYFFMQARRRSAIEVSGPNTFRSRL